MFHAFALGPSLVSRLHPLAVVALTCAVLSAIILVRQLFERGPLDAKPKVALLFGLVIFPLGVAFSGNVAGYEATKDRTFCGSCHVMTPYQHDSDDPKSTSLAARHGRNKLFGEENCYVCHADYGMFGTVVTKLGGLRHVWLYYTEYDRMSLEEAREKIHILRPFPNQNCMQCHSTENALWEKRKDHRASIDDVRSGRLSCASAGCHGFAHPFSKPPASATAPSAGAPPASGSAPGAPSGSAP